MRPQQVRIAPGIERRASELGPHLSGHVARGYSRGQRRRTWSRRRALQSAQLEGLRDFTAQRVLQLQLELHLVEAIRQRLDEPGAKMMISLQEIKGSGQISLQHTSYIPNYHNYTNTFIIGFH